MRLMDLQKKNLVTYSLKTRVSEQNLLQGSSTWVDLLIAQSYHVGTPISPARRFSDIWGLARFNRPVSFTRIFSDFQISVDTFYNPYQKYFSQWNTDARVLSGRAWYLEVGQRFTRSGPRVRRGDIWNPISFNEVLSSGEEIFFLTAGGAIRLPFGLSVGSKVYRDIRTNETSELDIVGFYQNPCRCFSIGLYYIQFPDRTQFNFLFSLTGLWAGSGEGQGLMQTIFEPIFAGERGVPWSKQ